MATSARKKYSIINTNQQLLNINTIFKSNIENLGNQGNQGNLAKPGNYKLDNKLYKNASSNGVKINNGLNGLNELNGLNGLNGLNAGTGSMQLVSVNNIQNTPEVLSHENNLNRINSIVNGNQNAASRLKYKITKFLGHGIKGNLYLASDNAGKRVICKEIILEEDEKAHSNNIARRQIEFELNILKYLSQNDVAREHINPCLDYTIHNNTVYTIFPVFNGYSLGNFYGYLSRSSVDDYYKLLFYLIKSLLHALSKIHETGIAHQNINERSILVSTFINPREIKVKFTDFGLGCGNLNKGIGGENGNIIAVDDYIKTQPELNVKNNIASGIASCRDNCYAPVTFTAELFRQLRDSDFLQVAQMYDVLCLGLIFIKYLLSFDTKLQKLDLTKPVDNINLESIRTYLHEKYIAKARQSLSMLNLSNNIKKVLVTYIQMITRFMLCPTINRKPAQYVLDKLIIYEKYKNDIF